jgi:hypothetical protein
MPISDAGGMLQRAFRKLGTGQSHQPQRQLGVTMAALLDEYAGTHVGPAETARLGCSLSVHKRAP